MRRLLTAEIYRQVTTYAHAWRDTTALLVRSLISLALIAFFCSSLPEPSREFLLVSSALTLLVANAIIGANHEISHYARGDRAAQFFSRGTNPLDWCLAISIIQLAIAILLAALGAALFLPIHPPVHPAATALGVVSAALISLLVASLVGLHSARSGSFRTSSLAIGVVLLFSGMFYPISTLPAAMRAVAFVSPYTYALDLARIGYAGGNHSVDPRVSTGAVTLAVLVLTIALALMRRRAHKGSPYDT